MFIQQKDNAIFKVSLTLERVLSPFWELSKNLLKEGLLKYRDYTEFDSAFEQGKVERMNRCDDLFVKSCDIIKKGKGTDEEKQLATNNEDRCKYDTVFAEAFQLILNHYMQKILSPDCFATQIKKSCSLIVFKPEGECIFVAEGGVEDQFDKEFRNCLCSLKIVEDFLKFLNGGLFEQNSFNPKIYANIFSDNFWDGAVSIASPLYPKDNLVAKDEVVCQKSDYQIWYNGPCLRSLGYIDLPEGVIFELKIKDKLIALEQGGFILPMVTEWQPYFTVSNHAELLWTNYQNRIYNNIEKSGENKSKPVKLKMTNEEKAFVEAASSEDFTNILSHLVDNLYLPNDAPAVKAEYQAFFHNLMKIEELQHLMDYKLYVPDHDQPGTILGVYKIHRLQKETEYNLRHMLYSQQDGDKLVFKDYYGGNRKVTTVTVLKPQYASFYMMDYYEFFVEAILIKLKKQGVIKDYLRNQRYTYKESGGNKSIEIDVMVYNGKKIFLFELKTMLHIEFLNTYPQRYATLLAEESMSEIYSFHLVSSFADDNIAVLNYPEIDGYNTTRADLNTIPYKFEVAIPGTKKKLHCLAESSYDRLKAELTRIFQA